MNKWERKIRFQQNKGLYVKRGTILLSVILLILGVIYITYSKFESTQEYTLINGKITSNGDVSIVAIYQGDTKVDSIPQKGGLWTFDRAECTNATGSWNIDDWGLYINNIIGKVKCNLYFKPNMVSYINTLGTTDTTNLIADGTTDNNLRYVGESPNNYVTFNGELWRIIGVMNNVKIENGQTQSLVKIIRNESLGNYAWDTSSSDVNSGFGINQWGESNGYEGADLMRELNNDYLGDVKVGTDGKWYSDSNNTKNAPMPTSNLSQASQNMVESVVWNLGSPNNNEGTHDLNSVTPSTSYERERSLNTGKICTSGNECNDNIVRTSTWTGKVALMYPSDYGYATVGKNGVTREQCLAFSVHNWNDYFDGPDGVERDYWNCALGNWLYNLSDDLWLISPESWENKAYYVYNTASSNDSTNTLDYYSFPVHPSLYLKSGVAITGGEGTEANPYTLG